MVHTGSFVFPACPTALCGQTLGKYTTGCKQLVLQRSRTHSLPCFLLFAVLPRTQVQPLDTYGISGAIVYLMRKIDVNVREDSLWAC